MDTVEGENVQTNTNLQPKKLSSQTRLLSKNAETVLKLTTNAWWPFDRVDGRILEQLHKQAVHDVEEAPI